MGVRNNIILLDGIAENNLLQHYEMRKCETACAMMQETENKSRRKLLLFSPTRFLFVLCLKYLKFIWYMTSWWRGWITVV